MNALRIALCSLLLLMATVTAMAQGTYTQIDVPGADFTQCYGINNAGDIVGAYFGNGTFHGFLLSSGTYTRIDSPTGNTQLTGINDSGQIVGISATGFLYDLQTGVFTKVQDPASDGQTTPTAINNGGTVAGYYISKNHYQGFELIGSTYTRIALSGAADTHVFGVSGSGTLVGTALAKNSFSFSFKQGIFKKLLIPDNVQQVSVAGINPSGSAAVGSYMVDSFTNAGFIFENGIFDGFLEFPGAPNTQATGVNDTGEIVGWFADSSSRYHGFVWTPSPGAPKP